MPTSLFLEDLAYDPYDIESMDESIIISQFISIAIAYFSTAFGFGFEAFGYEIYVEDDLLLLPNKPERALIIPPPPPELFLDDFFAEPLDIFNEPLNSQASKESLISSQAIAPLTLFLLEF